MTNNDNYSKSFTIKSIMGNPKLSKILFDAWKAPVGSTKNTHAKSIMKSLERTTNNYIADGRGGPGLRGAVNPFLNIYNPEEELPGPRLPSPTQPSGLPNQTFNNPPPPSSNQPWTLPGNNNPLMYKPPVGQDPTQTTTPQLSGEQEESRGSVFLKTIDDLEESKTEPTTDPPPAPPPLFAPPPPTFNYKDILDKYGVQTKTPTTPDYLSSVQKAADAGVGPNTFATQALANKEMLAEILQVPQETLDWLPESGFLSDYTNELKQETKSRYDLDAQLQKVHDLESTGLTVESDLQAYVRGKDKYFNQLDKLYNNAATKIANIDTSDPRDAKRMGNYLNYLTILKGRQNQRYMDYVNTSVKTHDAKVTRASNLYKLTREKFDDDFADLKEGATEKYGILKDTISEMYTNISDREKNIYDDTSRQLNLIEGAIQIETGILNNERLKDEVDGTKLSSDFYTFTNSLLNELQSGESWGTVWNKVKQRYPNASNEDINIALGGGVADTEEQAATHDVKIGEPWGWARPGAFQERKASTSSGNANKAFLDQPLYLRKSRAKSWLATDYDGVNLLSGGRGMSEENLDIALPKFFGLSSIDLI